MVDGASADDKKVLAALAVATNLYGGVIELTGSDAFKQKAMQLIVEYDIKVRMKLPAQRAALEKLRKEKEMAHDAIVTHRPTPELNRQSPEETTMAQPLPLCHRRQRLNKQQAVRLKHRIRKRRSRQKLKPPGPTDRNNPPPRRLRQKKPLSVHSRSNPTHRRKSRPASSAPVKV